MKGRVVVVDDDPENCRALAELLTAEGFEVLAFPSGEAAWLGLQDGSSRADALVADVRMPDMDGLALLRQIKSRFQALPVVLVSAFPDERVWADAILAGAADVFPKPIRGMALATLLQQLIEGSRPPVQS